MNIKRSYTLASVVALAATLLSPLAATSAQAADAHSNCGDAVFTYRETSSLDMHLQVNGLVKQGTGFAPAVNVRRFRGVDEVNQIGDGYLVGITANKETMTVWKIDGNKIVNVSEIGAGWQTMGQIIGLGDRNFVAIHRETGAAYFYQLNADGKGFHSRSSTRISAQDLRADIQTGLEGRLMIATADKSGLYALKKNGQLVQLRLKDLAAPGKGWQGEKVVWDGFRGMKAIYGAGDGILYAVNSVGKMFNYNHIGVKERSDVWRSPRAVDTQSNWNGKDLITVSPDTCDGVTAAQGWTRPFARNTISQHFGGQHFGTDYAVASGSAVGSIAAGKVIAVGNTQASGGDKYGRYGFGHYVIVAHTIGGKSYTSLYAHLSAVSVSEGQTVQGGQKIGAVGSTGNSTGPHLHLAVYRASNNAQTVDANAFNAESLFD